MNREKLQSDIKVMGFVVDTFPDGIGHAFEKLEQMLPDGETRTFYGISDCSGTSVKYKAAALQVMEDEAGKYGLETFTIQKGEYIAEPVYDWMSKTNRIKDVFAVLCGDEFADCNSNLVEVYKTPTEMVCMVRVDNRKVLAQHFEDATKELINLFSSFADELINVKPKEGGWTIAQVAEHIRKSHGGIQSVMTGPSKKTQRDPSQWMEKIKNDFLDFTEKNKSPEFVVPEDRIYDKARLLNGLQRKMNEVSATIKSTDPEETCILFPFPVYGELTRMELAQFMTYHARRHAQQVRNIAKSLTGE
jgi:hypothetical protein